MLRLVVGRDTETIQAALNQVAHGPAEIIILPGVYHERLRVYGQSLRLIGLGKVVIDAAAAALQRDDDGQIRTTFRTATVFVNGQDIDLVNLTIKNTAGLGRHVGQAVALFGIGRAIRVRHCRLLAHQDTLCLGPLPPYQKDGYSCFITERVWHSYAQQDYHFMDCEIAGTVDFIFGGGEAWFDNCLLRPLTGDGIAYITAASTAKYENGFVFRCCAVVSEAAQPYYLGRPWRPFGKTRFERCWFGAGLAQGAWSQWANTLDPRSATYAESGCLDEDPAIQRVAWVVQE